MWKTRIRILEDCPESPNPGLTQDMDAIAAKYRGDHSAGCLSAALREATPRPGLPLSLALGPGTLFSIAQSCGARTNPSFRRVHQSKDCGVSLELLLSLSFSFTGDRRPLVAAAPGGVGVI